MANNGSVQKGITIDFKADTTKLDKSLNDVNKKFDKEKVILKEINSELKLDPKNVEILKDKLSSLTTQEELLKTKIEEYKKSLDNISDKDIGGKEWQHIQKEITDANYELARTEKQIEAINQKLRENNGIANLGKSLEDAGKGAEELGKKLAPVSAVAGAISGAFVKITKDASANADELLTLSKQYGISVEQLQKYQSASELIDVSLETLVKSHAKLTKAMGSSSKETQKAFTELGVAVRDTNGEYRDSEEVFNEVIKKLGEVGNETQADIYANALFGKSFAELNPLIRGGAEQLSEWNKYLEENSLILSDDQVQSLGELDDAFQTLKSTLAQVGQIIASDLAPMITKAVKKISEIVVKLKEKWEGLSPTMKKVIPIVAGITTALAPLLMIGRKITSSIGSMIKLLGTGGGLNGVLKALTSPIGLIISALGILYATNEDFRKSINDLVGSLLSALKPLVETLGSLIGNIANQLSSILAPVIDNIVNLLSNGVVPFIKNLVEALMPVLETILNSAVDLINQLVSVVSNLFNKLNESGILKDIADMISNLLSKIAPLINKLVQTLLPIIMQITNFLIQTLVPIIDTLISVFADKILPVISQLFEALMPLIDEVLNVLIELLGTIFDAISEVWNILSETGIFDTLIEILTTLIDIIGNIFSKLSELLMPVIQLIADIISNVLMPIINTLVSILQPIIDVVLQTLVAVIQTIIGVISELFGWLEQVGIIDAFGKIFETIGKIIDKVVGIVKTAVEWIGKLIQKVKDFLGSGFEAIGNFFGGLFGGGNEANINVNNNGTGRNALLGANITLHTNINVSNANNITEKDFKNWGKSMIDTINDELGNLLG